MLKSYHPESYWSAVATRIKARSGKNVVAGDDEPYYRYKRDKFLKMLSSVDFKDKSVLEVGCGPGGNLEFIAQLMPKKLVGADISAEMVALAKSNLSSKKVEIFKTNGTSLPFESHAFDLVLTATVLQHNTDEKMLATLLADICRVSAQEIFLFEKIDNTIKGDELCMARPVEYYQQLASKHGFELQEVRFMNIYVSYLVAGVIRKILNRKNSKRENH
ncbi:MAG: class I SAM-dependent methyltransferase [Saprospiraceae bacterium]|nr:class I SAM-dependent methyltransferase [Saprospiraceae bacterium]